MDIRSLDLRLLRGFICLCEECSVSRAALRMHVTQSAMSGMLARLRVAFDDALFVRTKTGLRPTARAVALAPAVKDILGRIDALASASEFDPARARNVVSIAANDFIQSVFLAPVVTAIRAEAPGMQLQFRQLNADRLKADLLRGDLDLALIARHHAPHELPSVTLFEQKYVCAVGRAHRLAGRARLTIEDIAAETHVSVSPAPDGSNWLIDEAFARAGVRRLVGVHTPTFLVAPDMLEAGDFVAVLPEDLARRYAGRLKLFPMPLDIPPVALAMLWNPDSRNEPANRWVRQRIQTITGALAGKSAPAAA